MYIICTCVYIYIYYTDDVPIFENSPWLQSRLKRTAGQGADGDHCHCFGPGMVELWWDEKRLIYFGRPVCLGSVTLSSAHQ